MVWKHIFENEIQQKPVANIFHYVGKQYASNYRVLRDDNREWNSKTEKNVEI